MTRNILDFCEIGDQIEVVRCLSEGACPNFQNNEGESPLQVAAANGFSNLVALLLKHGASIDLPNNYGWTPLMHAARYGQTSTVALLLKMKAKVNVCNKLGISAMVTAACSGNLSTLKLLVEAGAMIDHMSAGNETNECDLSPLMAASLHGHVPILQYLMESGVEINHSSSITGLTPLMLATCGGHKSVIHMLVEKGADVNKKDLCGRKALDIASVFNNLEAKTYLENLTSLKTESGSSQNSDILQAIRSGDILKVKTILEKDHDSLKSADSHDGTTPLILASSLGHYDIVNLLISCGATINALDADNGWTALMHAVFHRHTDVVRLLVEMGADIDICTPNGYTALDLAQQNDSIDSTIADILTPRSALYEVKSSNLTPDPTSRGRLSAPERLPSKRSLSQTRVKEWIGGVAHHLQNKMLTRRSPKFSENVPSIEITLTDDSANEVFLEQTTSKEYDKEKINQPVMLPPNLYLASALKEHKVEAITPPFPPTSDLISNSRGIAKKKALNAADLKPRLNFLFTPNLLRNYKKKSFANSNRSDVKNIVATKERYALNESKKDCTIKHEEICQSLSSEVQQKPHKLEDTDSHMKTCPGDLTVLLNKESLQKYAETFRDQEVDIETFQHLTETDLKEIGIQNLESQKKLMEVIKKLKISE